MSKFIKKLGVFILTLLIITIPILFTCNLIYKWSSILSFVLCVFMGMDFGFVNMIIDVASKNNRKSNEVNK